jgi:hypothetical protein
LEVEEAGAEGMTQKAEAVVGGVEADAEADVEVAAEVAAEPDG